MAKRRNGYTVGHGRPPRDTQFKRGQSGNKKGRPKKSNTFIEILEEELQKSEIFNVKGVPKKLKFDRAIVKQALAQATKNNFKPLVDLFKLARMNQPEVTASADDEAFNRDADKLVIDSVVRRIRRLDPLPAPAEPSSDAAPATDETPPLPDPTKE